jgi:hypothetical protein
MMGRATTTWCRSAAVLLLLASAACSSGGSDSVIPPPGPNEVELHLDGDNFSAPFLDVDTYQAAVRFTAVQTGPYAGEELTEVEFFIEDIPAGCKVKVYGQNTATAPGAQLYASADVTGALTAHAWNTHTLNVPVVVPNGDLWIAIELTHAVSQQSIGCDPGPGVEDGRWLYSTSSPTWAPFLAHINWNIRGVVTVTP